MLKKRTVNPEFYIKWSNPSQMKAEKTFPVKKNKELIGSVTLKDMLKELRLKRNDTREKSEISLRKIINS